MSRSNACSARSVPLGPVAGNCQRSAAGRRRSRGPRRRPSMRSRGLRAVSPIISSPTRSAAPGPLATTPTSRPREMTAIRSQISSSSSRSVEMTSAEPPPVASLPDQVAHGRGRLHVEPVRRLVEDDHLRLEAQLAGEQDLLDVAAGERAGPRRHGRRADVELADELGRRGRRRPPAGCGRAARTDARRCASGTGSAPTGRGPTIPSPSRSSVT